MTPRLAIRLCRSAWFLAFAAFSLTHTGTVSAVSPKIERIVERHLKAVGGDKLKAIDALRADGEVEVRGFTVPFTAWWQRPNRSRLDLSIMGYDVIQAYDGSVAWWLNPVAGVTTAQVMPEDFAREMKLWSDFTGPLVDYERKRYKLKYLGKEELKTGEAYKLRVAMSGGVELLVYIDGETYLEVRRTYTQTIEGKSITVHTNFSDFTDTDGVTTPRTIAGVGFGGTAFVMRFKTLDLDVEPDPTRFELPDAKKKSGLYGN